METTDTDRFQAAEIPYLQMACITYLNSFPAPNALEILKQSPEHEVVRIAGDAPIEESFGILGHAHAYQCVGARDEVPIALRVDGEFLSRAPELLVVSASGSGVDVFDLDACTTAGVLAVNQAGANAQSVAEHALAMIIGVQRAIVRVDRMLRSGWQGSRLEFMGTDLARKTVGIVGIGNIGTRLAEICSQGFGCTVLAADPYLDEAEIETRGAHGVTFGQLLQQADIVSVHTPLTSATQGLFDAGAFAQMKAGAVFINTARGSIHDEDALADALASGHLGGAGLDVWEVEPPQPDHRLMQMKNVIATPHVAGCTSDSLQNMAEHAATQLLDIFSGKPATRPVNPAVLPRFRERYAQILGEPAPK